MSEPERKKPEPILAWFADTLTPIVGGGWQYHVRKALGLYAGELLPLLKSDLDEGAIEGAECLISQYLCERANKLQQQADKAAAVAAAFDAAARKRRLDVEIAERCKIQSEIEVLTDLIFEQSLVNIEAAARAA